MEHIDVKRARGEEMSCSKNEWVNQVARSELILKRLK